MKLEQTAAGYRWGHRWFKVENGKLYEGVTSDCGDFGVSYTPMTTKHWKGMDRDVAAELRALLFLAKQGRIR